MSDETAKLYAAFQAAKVTGNREATKAAWAAYEATLPRRPQPHFASRAGQRQAAERRCRP